MIVTIKRYRLSTGFDIEKYLSSYCGFYPDEVIVKRLQLLSTKSLVKAYAHVKNNCHLSMYYRNVHVHLTLELEKRNNIIDGVLIHDFEEDDHLELAPDYY